ncbi:MAG TPA: hypothetical protein VIV14_10235 [Gammaproteobacteria bacterium]
MNALYALALLACLLWALWMLAVAYIFIDPAPVYDASASLMRRLVVKLRRGLGVLISIAMTAMLAVAVSLTFRAVSLMVSA